MFKEDGNVIHFKAPKGALPTNRPGTLSSPLLINAWYPKSNGLSQVHAAIPSNTFAIYGNGEDKELTELVPGILNQLGPDSLNSLRKLAESYQAMQKKEGAEGDKKDDDDDDIPDLVPGETFDKQVE